MSTNSIYSLLVEFLPIPSALAGSSWYLSVEFGVALCPAWVTHVSTFFNKVP